MRHVTAAIAATRIPTTIATHDQYTADGEPELPWLTKPWPSFRTKGIEWTEAATEGAPADHDRTAIRVIRLVRAATR